MPVPLPSQSAPPAAPLEHASQLIGPGDWLGTTLGWSPGPSEGAVVVTLSPDQALLDANRTDALRLYSEVEAQLSRPGTLQVAVTSSLNSAAKLVPVASAPADLGSYVGALLAYLGGTGPFPPGVTIGYEIAEPVAGLPPIQVDVTLTLAHFGDGDIARPFARPNIHRVDTRVPACLADGWLAFTGRFRRAFPQLRLALDGRRLDAGVLWVCGARLVRPTIAGGPTYFAPVPLGRDVQSGQTLVPDFADFSQERGWTTSVRSFVAVDGDRSLAGCFQTIDRLLTEPLASAVKQATASGYESLVAMRAALAATYANRQLSWVFAQQIRPASDESTLRGARAAYRRALQDTLRAAYAIDAILAFEATWNNETPSWPGQGLSLLGFVRSADGSRAWAASSAHLRLDGDGAQRGTLYHAFRPNDLTANAAVTGPLEFVVTHVGTGDLPEGAQTWIALLEQETVRIGDGTAVAIPVVNRFAPRGADLRAQQATPSTPTHPTFSQLLQWDYSADIMLQPVAQDVATVVVRRNIATDFASASAGDGVALAAALVRFHMGFAQVEPVLADLIAGRPSAANIVAAILDLVAAVQNSGAWEVDRRAAVSPSADPATATRLLVSLAADPSTAGTWNLTVESTPTLPTGSLSVRPYADAETLQPNVQVVRTDPLVVSYVPADPTAPVLVRVALKQLGRAVVQNACGEARVTRNAVLLAPFTTAPEYVLSTPPSRFPQPVSPIIVGPDEGYDVTEVGHPPASGLLADWLQMLFGATLDGAPSAEIGLSISYALRLGRKEGGVDQPGSLSSTLPIFLVGVTSIDNGGGVGTPLAEFATAVAEAVVRWFRVTQPSMEDAQLVFDLTLRATVMTGGPALLRAPNLRLALDRISDLR